MEQFKVTNTSGFDITLDDMGGLVIAAAAVDVNIFAGDVFHPRDIRKSTDMQAELDSGDITAIDENSRAIKSVLRYAEDTEQTAGIYNEVPVTPVAGQVWVYDDSVPPKLVLKTMGIESLPAGVAAVEYYEADEGESSTTVKTPSYTLKLEVTHPITSDGNYTIETYFEVRSSASNKIVACRVLVDAIESMTFDSDTNLNQGSTGFIRVSKLTGQDLVVRIEYARVDNGMTAYIRRARVKITKIT